MLTSLRIGPRLALGFATVLTLSVAVGLFSVDRLARVNDNAKDLATNWLLASRTLGDYGLDVETVRRAEAAYAAARTADEAARQGKLAADARERAAQDWKRYAATVTTPEEAKLAAATEAGQAHYDAGRAVVMAAPVDTPEARDKANDLLRGASSSGFAELEAALHHSMEFQSQGGDAAYAESQATYSSAVTAIIALLASATAAGALFAWTIARSITRPLARAVTVAQTVAEGNLTSDIDATSPDETGQLLRALQRMNASLVDIVSKVRFSADSIATGSGQIAAGNADLSQRTEEQASNLQQTAASMEQLTATVKQNSDTARAASQIAGTAAQAATDGGQVVSRVISTMDEISQSSRRIVDIIGVIDGIAFQTNILALNAAVEAARAGEQGRGFAVVATEVRGLAQRSAAAAKEIKVLIDASVEKVASGTRLVDEAGQSMAEIVTQVKRANDLVSEISAASLEQTTGIAQIGDAVTQLDQVTQQNAALVEESAAAAESLKVQSAQLANLVAVFTVA